MASQGAKAGAGSNNGGIGNVDAGDAGDGGKSGDLGGPSDAGDQGTGSGGSAGRGDSGDAGETTYSGPCTVVTASNLTEVLVDPSMSPRIALFELDIVPPLGLQSFHDTLQLQFWDGGSADGARTGTFALGDGADSDYATCSRCVLAYQDRDAAPGLPKLFFQTAGTLVTRSTSRQMEGFPDLSLRDVTLSEVTVDPVDDHTSLVPDGACLHFAAVSLTVPPSWSCDPKWIGDGDCDCGCGTQDPDCTDSSTASCDWCWCGDGPCPGGESPSMNFSCG